MICPKFCNRPCPRNQRARGRPDARCTRGLAGCSKRDMLPTSIQVQRRTSGLPCAMVLRLIRFRPGDRLSCHHHRAKHLLRHDLTPAPGRRDPNDFAVCQRPRSSVAASRPPLPAPRSRRWPTPLWMGQDGGSFNSDLPDGATGLFYARGLDGPNHIEFAGEIRTAAHGG